MYETMKSKQSSHHHNNDDVSSLEYQQDPNYQQMGLLSSFQSQWKLCCEPWTTNANASISFEDIFFACPEDLLREFIANQPIMSVKGVVKQCLPSSCPGQDTPKTVPHQQHCPTRMKCSTTTNNHNQIKQQCTNCEEIESLLDVTNDSFKYNDIPKQKQWDDEIDGGGGGTQLVCIWQQENMIEADLHNDELNLVFQRQQAILKRSLEQTKKSNSVACTAEWYTNQQQEQREWEYDPSQHHHDDDDIARLSCIDPSPQQCSNSIKDPTKQKLDHHCWRCTCCCNNTHHSTWEECRMYQSKEQQIVVVPSIRSLEQTLYPPSNTVIDPIVHLNEQQQQQQHQEILFHEQLQQIDYNSDNMSSSMSFGSVQSMNLVDWTMDSFFSD